MMTNNYLPCVCGVTRSIVQFTEALRGRGHRVLVVAPSPDPPIDDGPGVVRVPAIPNFTVNDIAVRLPLPGYLSPTLDEFQPDVIHVHHPFLLGSTGLRIAAGRSLPVVFTYHTMYEHYTHYITPDSAALERFTIRMATDFANLCDRVIAPSQSVADVLRERGVNVPIPVVPTGIDTRKFAAGDGRRARQRHGIGAEAFVVGHVGRLEPEKNLAFLARAVSRFLAQQPEARFFVVGDGSSRSEIQAICESAGVGERLHLSEGKLEGAELFDAYRAMDVMAFSSHSETQGMVLAEGMSAGMPVVALDAPGARDIVRDGENGRLLAGENEEEFAAALDWVFRTGRHDERVKRGVARTAAEFSMDHTVEQLEAVYEEVCKNSSRNYQDGGVLQSVLQRIAEECQIWARIGHAVYDAAFGDQEATTTNKKAS
jgi:glycosyltransferase involved in cell wall biosynthesis